MSPTYNPPAPGRSKAWRKATAALGAAAVTLTSFAGFSSFAFGEEQPGSETTAGSDLYHGQEVITSADANPRDPRTISGTVRIEGSQEGGASTYNIGAYKKDQPLEGVTVYAQWSDGRNGILSPIHKTTSDANGVFTIKFEDFYTGFNEVHKFDANAKAAIGGYEKIRVWADAPAGKEDLQFFWGYGQSFAPKALIEDSGYGGVNWKPVPHWVDNVNIFFSPRPKVEDYTAMHKPHDQWQPTKIRQADGYGQMTGQVFWENGGGGAAKLSWQQAHLYHKKYDKSIGGQKIVASYLTDHAIGEIMKHFQEVKATDFPGVTNFRDNSWTVDHEDKLQAWIKEQIKVHPEWIAESVTGVSGTDGKYVIQFNGLYGQWPGQCAKVPAGRCDTVAASPNDGNWNQGASLQRTDTDKHVNWEWMNVSLVQEDEGGNVTLGPVPGVSFKDPWLGGRWSGRYGFPFGNLYTKVEQSYSGYWSAVNYLTDQSGPATYWKNVDFVMSLANAQFAVVDYNTSDRPANPGTTVKTTATGLKPIGDEKYAVVWSAIDANGNDVTVNTKCEGLTPDIKGVLPSCDIQVPADATDGTVYTARLYPISDEGTYKEDSLLGLDSFVVQRVIQGSIYDEITDLKLFQSKDLKVTAESLPKGLTVAENGTLSGTPTVAGTTTVKLNVEYTIGKTKKTETVYREFVITDTPLAEGSVGSPYEQAVKPTGFREPAESDDDQTPDINEASGYTIEGDIAVSQLPAGLVYAEGKITGTPTEENAATEEAPNVKVEYTLRHTNGSAIHVVDMVPLPIKKALITTQWTPSYEAKDVIAGNTAKSTPTFDDVATADTVEKADAPDGTTFKLADGAPVGAEINSTTGEVTYVAPKGAATETVSIPVIVTYEDQSTDNVDAVFNVKADTDGDGVPDPADPADPQDGEDKCPDVAGPAENGGCPWTNNVDPKYEDATGQPGDEVTIEAPTFVDPTNGGGATTKPAGTTFALGDGAPTYANVNSDTGVITVNIPADTQPTEITVPVVVTYPDNSTDTVNAKVTVGTPDGLNVIEDQTVIEGNPITEVPVVPDNNGAQITIDGAPNGVSYNSVAKNITGVPTIDNWADGETERAFEVTVKATNPNGSSATETFTITVKRDSDGDGVPDPKNPADPQEGEDKCPDTPEADKDKVDEHGCTIAQLWSPSYAPKDVIAGQKVTSDPMFDNLQTEEVETGAAPENTKFGLGKNPPAGATITTEHGVISYTPPADTQTGPVEVPVKVTYSDGSTAVVNAVFNVKADSDGDGVPDPKDPADPQDGEDKCAGTPKDAKVDGDGCALAPTTGEVPEVQGEKGKEITPVVVPVENLGMATDLKCSSEDLPKGLTVAYDEAKGGCVISGTPTVDTVKDQPFTVKVEFTKPDGDKTAGEPIKATGKANITLPALDIDPNAPTVDSDGDGVPDPKDPADPQDGEDKCADTPKDAAIDEHGCTVAPEFSGQGLPEITGEKGQPIDEVTIPFGNPGKATGLKCEAKGLAAGLEIEVNAEGTACIISGTPTEAINGKYSVTITSNRVDGDKGPHDPVTRGDGNIVITEEEGVTPAAPKFSNPSADDPATCEVQPFATVEPQEGVVYTVTVDGKEITPNAEGKYVYEYGQTILIKATPAEGTTFAKDAKTEWSFTAQLAEHCTTDGDNDGVPDYKDKCADTPEGAKVDENGCAITPSVPNDLPTIDGQKDKPIDDVVIPIDNPGKATDLVCKAEGLPEGLTITYVEGKGCVISGTPTEVKDGEYTITIDSKRPDGDKGDNTPVEKDGGKVNISEAPAAPSWDDATGKPGEDIVIPNNGGVVPDGTTIDIVGPGTGVLDEDGSIKVTIDKDAKPGDTITVTVKDKDGNVLDTVTVTVAEVPQAPVVKETGLAKTGLDLNTLALMGLGTILAGAVAIRRRKES